MQQKSAADRFAPLFILTAGAMWGSMGLFVRVLGKIGCSSFEIVFLRSIVTAICLFLVLAVRDRSLFRVRLRDLWCFFGTGVLSIVFFNLCYFTTIRLSSLAVAAVLLYTAPAIVIVLSAILFQEKITSRKLVALILTLVGCICVSGMLSGDINELYDSLNYDHEYFMDWFDELFPAIKASGFGGYLGYDSYEQDYYPLEWWESEYAESESRKKMLRLTKHQILDRVGKALAIIANYISIKYRYDCLETSINVIKGVNVANAELVKGIEAAYEAAYNATNGTFGKCPEVARLDDLEWQLPAQCWL